MPRLLDLGFLELDMLLRDGIVLLHRELVGHGARILLRHVEIARIGSRDELHFDGGGFGHGRTSWFGDSASPKRKGPGELGRNCGLKACLIGAAQSRQRMAVRAAPERICRAARSRTAPAVRGRSPGRVDPPALPESKE